MSELKDQEISWAITVEALSDLSICKVLAKIEELTTYVKSDAVFVAVNDGEDYYFNPLTNNDQCLNLIIKHDVERTYEHYDCIGWNYHVVGGDNPIRIIERQDFEGEDNPDIPMQKASCLAIILNKATAEMLDECDTDT